MEKLSIQHINDTHSHFQSQALTLKLKIDNKITTVRVMAGGYSLLKSYLDNKNCSQENNNNSNYLFHGGDCFEGTLFFNCFKGKANSRLSNELNFDAMVIGNHEFDTGDECLSEFINDINFPIICSNLNLPSSGTPLNKHNSRKLICKRNSDYELPYLIVTKNNTSLAVIGLTIDSMHEIASPSDGLKFEDPIIVARQTVERIKAEHEFPIIVLSHLGFDKDCKLASLVSDIDLIVGGHSHTILGDFSNIGIESTGMYPYKVGSTSIVHAGYNCLFVGDVTLDTRSYLEQTDFSGNNKLLVDRSSIYSKNDFSSQKSKMIIEYLDQQTNIALLDNNHVIDQIINNNFLPSIKSYGHNILTNCYTPKFHTRIPSNNGGSQLAPLVAKAMLEHVNSGEHIKADFAIINAGAIRHGLELGEITAAHISGKILPFSINLHAFSLKGKYIKVAIASALKNAYSCSSKTGSYPYSDKLHVDYLLIEGKPNILSFKLVDGNGFHEIIDEKEYTIASSSYLSKGKEGYLLFKTTRTHLIDFSIGISDVFIQYLKSSELN
ncbi:bifunctional metallophosphatase/5'-nucleotidase [Marinomonas sp. TI.3.20]|uniref:bifunctional metallophosphatase/5'-nucleotidase n=1 Tax=Marinomonas sp. TI.3.20 TaxID=3121296 RepID=UPI00311E3D6B